MCSPSKRSCSQAHRPGRWHLIQPPLVYYRHHKSEQIKKCQILNDSLCLISDACEDTPPSLSLSSYLPCEDIHLGLSKNIPTRGRLEVPPKGNLLVLRNPLTLMEQVTDAGQRLGISSMDIIQVTLQHRLIVPRGNIMPVNWRFEVVIMSYSLLFNRPLHVLE